MNVMTAYMYIGCLAWAWCGVNGSRGIALKEGGCLELRFLYCTYTMMGSMHREMK